MSYAFFKKNLEKRCYWCGKDNREELSIDHLPPKSIFPKEEREDLQLITATICESCKKRHQRLGKDDQIFIQHMRFWASLRIGGKDIKQRIEECVRRGHLEKGGGIVLADYLKVYLSNGQTVDYPILKRGKKAILGVLDSVARGFYYRKSGDIIPECVAPELEFRPRGSFTPPMNLLTIMPPCVVKKHVFEFSPVLYQDEKFNFLCWEFKFYNLDPFPIYYVYNVNRN